MVRTPDVPPPMSPLNKGCEFFIIICNSGEIICGAKHFNKKKLASSSNHLTPAGFLESYYVYKLVMVVGKKASG